jgi:hypothetical protein
MNLPSDRERAAWWREVAIAALIYALGMTAIVFWMACKWRT